MVAGVRVFPKALKYIKNLWDSWSFSVDEALFAAKMLLHCCDPPKSFEPPVRRI
jgi:hypothetical protein